MKTQNLDWEIVPKGWAVCFNQECTKCNECLRFQAGCVVPQHATTVNCVTKHAISDGCCRLFASAQHVTYARGFTTVYDKVLKKDFTKLRKAMTLYLQNKGRYYKYMRGEMPLSPQLQEWIKELFSTCGYADSVKFDRLEGRYVFPWI